MLKDWLKGKKVNDLHTDYRAEVIAAEMIAAGIDLDQILITPIGSFKRPYSKEIAEVQVEIPEGELTEYLRMLIYREGIYDMLPQRLFHQPIRGKTIKSEEEIIEEIQIHRQQEKQARRFFSVFDTQIFSLKTLLSVKENRLDRSGRYLDLVSFFSPFWPVFDYLDLNQANFFLHFIPLFHQVRNNIRFMEKFAAVLLDIPVIITTRTKTVTRYLKGGLTLGKNKLGVDFITGESFQEDEEELVVTVGPLSGEQIDRFMPGAPNEKILHYLFDYLLPVGVNIILALDIAPEARKMDIGTTTKGANAYMGVNTYL